MILNDRYQSVTPPGTSYITEFTDFVQNLTYDDVEKMAEPYYMGYIPYEEMPDVLGASKQSARNEDGNKILEFTDAIVPENVPWFFTGRYSESVSSMTGGSCLYVVDSTTGKYVKWDGTYSYGFQDFGFLNSCSIQKVCSGYRFNIHFYEVYQYITTDGTYHFWNSKSIDLTLSQYISFLNGDIPLSISRTISAISETFSLNMYYDDIKTGEYTYTSPSGNKAYIYITDFKIPETNKDKDSVGLKYYSQVQVGIKRHVNIDGVSTPYLANYCWHYYGYYNEDNYLYINWSGSVPTVSKRVQPYTNILLGGFRCRIDDSFFTYAENQPIVNDNCVFQKTGSTTARLYRVFTPDEIFKTFSTMFTRISNSDSPVYGYGTGMYYPIFNEDNSPKWEYKDGDAATLESQLQPWQKDNITLNEFTPEDIPEYVPPVPDDRVSGSWLTNSDLVNFGNASGFVTQYVITAQQLANLGSYLWADFFDPDFLASMKVAVLEAGSLNTSDILNYISSIRRYPLDIAGHSYELDYTSQFYIGRGCKGIRLDNGTNTIGILPNFVHNLRTGWTTIPAIYGDFRDYEPNTRIIVYVPFCGEVELIPSQAINSEIRLGYSIDFSNGAVDCAVAIRPKESPLNRYIAHTLTGSMGANIQLTASNLSQVLQKGLGLAWNTIGKVTGTAIAAGGTVAGLQASEAEYGADLSESTTSAGDYMAGRLYNARNLKILGSSPNLPTFQGMQGTPSPTFGVSSGFSSFLVLTPNIQVQYRLYEDPSNYGHVCGYACNKTMKLGDLEGKGFTVCRNPDLSGVPATYDELVALRALLESGVYL